jgi:delta(3,5)-delta(2,4)-dienoyl-CoA isomerase
MARSIYRLMSSSSLPTFETLKLSQPKPHVTLVELNRPTKLNAMSKELFDELKACFEQLNTEKTCRAIVLTGSGKAFSTGIDVKYLSNSAVTELGQIDDIARKALHLRRMIQRTQNSLRAVDKCEKPVIAAVHGHCIGAGVDLTACCDIRYSSRDATFSIKEVDMGLAADVGTLQILPKLIIDHSRFRELVFTSRTFNANEAQQIGLIGRVFDTREALLDAAISIASVIARKSPVAVQGSKINLNYARDHSTDDSFNFISTWNSGMMLTEDILKSVMASSVSKEKSNKDTSNEIEFEDV